MNIKNLVHQKTLSTELKGNSQTGGKYFQITYLVRDSYPEYIENT